MGVKNPIIDSAILENNELQDEDLSLIISGLSNIKYLEKLVFKKNPLGSFSLRQLMPILQRRTPFQLRSLILCDVNLNPTDACDLLECLVETKKLRELAL